MKKAIIAIAALMAAAGISIGAFLAVKSNSDKETKKQEESKADNVLLELDSDSINKVDIINADGSYTIELNDETWVLTECTDSSFEVNQITAQGICTAIASLTAETSYGEINDANKEKYGLNEPYIVKVSDGESEHTLYIGSESPTGEYYYCYTDEKNKIYAIPYSSAYSIITTRLGLKDDNLIPYGDNDIIGLKLVRNGETVYDLNYDTENNQWKLPEKYKMLTINQTKINSLTSLLTRLNAETMLPETDEDFTLYGFDKPIAEFVIKGSDGTEKTLLMSSYGPMADTYTHVYIEESKQVETYYTSDLDFIEYEIIDFIMKNVECANMYAISEFEIESEDVSEKFTIDTAEGWAEFGNNKIDLNNAELLSYFEHFYDLFSYVSISDINVDIQPELKDPIFTAKYVLSDGDSTQVDFVSAGSGGMCFVFVDGEYTGTLTENQFIYGTDSVSAAFDLLCRQAGIK